MRYYTFVMVFILKLLLVSSVYANEELTLGVHPYKSVNKLQSYYLPLTDFLSKELKVQVNLSIAKDYDTHIKMIGKDIVDIAYMGPASYVAMVNKYGMKRLLARQVIKGKPTFKGNIIVRADTNINNFKDLENKRFAFGDPSSTMSHLVPRYMLIKNGITKNALKEINFLGSHDNVAIAVLSGEYDAGAVKEAVFHKYKGKGIRSLATTPELSEHLFVVSDKVSGEMVDKLRSILLNLNNHEKGKSILKGIKKSMTGMGEVVDADYKNLRKILDFLKKEKVIK